MKKVLITTLGCKVNQYESAAFRTGFEDKGLRLVKMGEQADLVIINTCAVTGSAGAQSRQAIRRALKKHSGADIIITGCYAELAAGELSEAPELSGRNYKIIGNSQKDILVQTALGSHASDSTLLLGAIKEADSICRLPVRRFGERSRAYLRIQDGCESFCTYCIVPYTRGPNRSLPVDEVIEQARVFAAEGHREIVLTGIHLGYYGQDLGANQNLVSLLDRLTQATPGTLYRISSLEPLEIDDNLLCLMQERTTIQPHLHIPLQSGNDEILQRMNRRYTTDQFREVIEKCHAAIDDLAIGIDILAGFPGETDHHFRKAQIFLESLDFTYLHVFPYSIRPGTKAADFPDQLSKRIKDERVAALRLLSDQKKSEFYRSQLGRTLPVLVESKRTEDGLLKGVTPNYITVTFAGDSRLLGSITTVQLQELRDNIVFGQRTENNEN